MFSKKAELNKDAILQKFAYAYSWMPTIPGIKESPKWEAIVAQLRLIESQDFSSKSVKKLLRLTVPVFNNSLIGVSKALHFCFPDYIPIIDTNVVHNWRYLFFENRVTGFKGCPIAPLPSGFGKTGGSKPDNISLYVTYCENMRYWAKVTNQSIRDLEVALFECDAGSNRKS